MQRSTAGRCSEPSKPSAIRATEVAGRRGPELRAKTARVLAGALVCAVAAGCGGSSKPPRPAAKQPHGAPLLVNGGRLIAIGGGRRLFIECAGTGRPAIVLEAGFGGTSDNWRDVQPQLGRTARTCAYDRAGLGNSVAIPGVHDAADEVRDVQRLLSAAGIAPPYVIVGHSYGGLLARLFAHEHPSETAGVVLVDAVGRDQTRRQLAIWPRSAAPRLRYAYAKPVVDGVDIAAGEALGARIKSLGTTPLAVVSAGNHSADLSPLPTRVARAQERLWTTMQDELARLSSNHVHVVALHSGHFVQRLDGQPDVVIRAVDAVVRAARSRQRLPACARLFTGPGVRCLP
jgi:pimeloyl-ACP methyl ester carboxylesterase